MQNENIIRLGVNIDHIATVRQARGGKAPFPLYAALEAEVAGADLITVHLREDRRHIQDEDVTLLKKYLQIPLNLEMAVTHEMVSLAKALQPAACCLVPEKRQELTTEGGLNLTANFNLISKACQELEQAGITVSLFIDPDLNQIELASRSGATAIEIHTGNYADAENQKSQKAALARIIDAAQHARNLGLTVHAGHGLNYHNVRAVSAIPEIEELNIGHAIITRALFTGLKEAIKEMMELLMLSRAI